MLVLLLLFRQVNLLYGRHPLGASFLLFKRQACGASIAVVCAAERVINALYGSRETWIYRQTRRGELCSPAGVH